MRQDQEKSSHFTELQLCYGMQQSVGRFLFSTDGENVCGDFKKLYSYVFFYVRMKNNVPFSLNKKAYIYTICACIIMG